MIRIPANSHFNIVFCTGDLKIYPWLIYLGFQLNANSYNH